MNLDEIKNRMNTGKLYFCNNKDLVDEQLECLEKLYDFNQIRPKEQEKKAKLLKKMFSEIGDNCYIEAPMYSNWGGKNVHFGNNVYANFNLTLVDDCDIYIGNYVMFAPNVTICTGTHPINPELRKKEAEYNLPVTIKDNVWIGAGSIVLPGVTIGENSVIGAGSVVTKDIPANVVAFGMPCKVSRKINENDKKYFNKNQIIDIE